MTLSPASRFDDFFASSCCCRTKRYVLRVFPPSPLLFSIKTPRRFCSRARARARVLQLAQISAFSRGTWSPSRHRSRRKADRFSVDDIPPMARSQCSMTIRNESRFGGNCIGSHWILSRFCVITCRKKFTIDSSDYRFALFCVTY